MTAVLADEDYVAGQVTWFGLGRTPIKRWNTIQKIVVIPQRHFQPQMFRIPSNCGDILIMQIEVAGTKLFREPVAGGIRGSSSARCRRLRNSSGQGWGLIVRSDLGDGSKPSKPKPSRVRLTTSRKWKGFWYVRQVWRQPRPWKPVLPVFMGGFYGSSLRLVELFDEPRPQLIFDRFAPTLLGPGSSTGSPRKTNDPQPEMTGEYSAMMAQLIRKAANVVMMRDEAVSRGIPAMTIERFDHELSEIGRALTALAEAGKGKP